MTWQKRNSKKTVIISMVVIFILLTAAYLGYNFLKKDETVDYFLIPKEKTDDGALTALERAAQVLMDKKFEALTKYGQWPLDEKRIKPGRNNPFLKFKLTE